MAKKTKPTKAQLAKAGPGARHANRIPLKVLEDRLKKLQKVVDSRRKGY